MEACRGWHQCPNDVHLFMWASLASPPHVWPAVTFVTLSHPSHSNGPLHESAFIGLTHIPRPSFLLLLLTRPKKQQTSSGTAEYSKHPPRAVHKPPTLSLTRFQTFQIHSRSSMMAGGGVADCEKGPASNNSGAGGGCWRRMTTGCCGSSSANSNTQPPEGVSSTSTSNSHGMRYTILDTPPLLQSIGLGFQVGAVSVLLQLAGRRALSSSSAL